MQYSRFRILSALPPVPASDRRLGTAGALFGNAQRLTETRHVPEPEPEPEETDEPEVADVVMINGACVALVDGEAIPLRHTQEALAAIRSK